MAVVYETTVRAAALSLPLALATICVGWCGRNIQAEWIGINPQSHGEVAAGNSISNHCNQTEGLSSHLVKAIVIAKFPLNLDGLLLVVEAKKVFTGVFGQDCEVVLPLAGAN